MLGACLVLACTAPATTAPPANPTQVAAATYVADVQGRIVTATAAAQETYIAEVQARIGTATAIAGSPADRPEGTATPSTLPPTR
jgi:hypothetical protein